MEDMGADPAREPATCGHPPVGAHDPTQARRRTTSTRRATTPSSTSTRSSTRRRATRTSSPLDQLDGDLRGGRRPRTTLHHARPLPRRPRLARARTASPGGLVVGRRVPATLGAADHAARPPTARTGCSSSPSTRRGAATRRRAATSRPVRTRRSPAAEGPGRRAHRARCCSRRSSRRARVGRPVQPLLAAAQRRGPLRACAPRLRRAAGVESFGDDVFTRTH